MKSRLLCSVFLVASIAAAQDNKLALLQKVDLRARGLPGYGLNLVPHYYGLYSLPSGELEVFVVLEPLPPPQGAESVKAVLGGTAFELQEGGFTLLLERVSDEAFLFRFVSPPPPELPAFIKAFEARYRFFVKNAKRESEISLPAIVEIR
jgi:hypothetical protein